MKPSVGRASPANSSAESVCSADCKHDASLGEKVDAVTLRCAVYLHWRKNDKVWRFHCDSSFITYSLLAKVEKCIDKPNFVL
jgi:hypothetical protein